MRCRIDIRTHGPRPHLIYFLSVYYRQQLLRTVERVSNTYVYCCECLVAIRMLVGRNALIQCLLSIQLVQMERECQRPTDAAPKSRGERPRSPPIVLPVELQVGFNATRYQSPQYKSKSQYQYRHRQSHVVWASLPQGAHRLYRYCRHLSRRGQWCGTEQAPTADIPPDVTLKISRATCP